MFFFLCKNLYTNFKVLNATPSRRTIFSLEFDLVFPVFFPGLGILWSTRKVFIVVSSSFQTNSVFIIVLLEARAGPAYNHNNHFRMT